MALKHPDRTGLNNGPWHLLYVGEQYPWRYKYHFKSICQSQQPFSGKFRPAQPTKFITYLDANNLYGEGQSQPLPVGDFHFLTSDEIAQLDIMFLAEDSSTGYIIDCDLQYPSTLHDNHFDYPLAPEHLTVTRDMLSPFAQNLAGHTSRPAKKLVQIYSTKKTM